MDLRAKVSKRNTLCLSTDFTVPSISNRALGTQQLFLPSSSRPRFFSVTRGSAPNYLGLPQPRVSIIVDLTFLKYHHRNVLFKLIVVLYESIKRGFKFVLPPSRS